MPTARARRGEAGRRVSWREGESREGSGARGGGQHLDGGLPAPLTRALGRGLFGRLPSPRPQRSGCGPGLARETPEDGPVEEMGLGSCDVGQTPKMKTRRREGWWAGVPDRSAVSGQEVSATSSQSLHRPRSPAVGAHVPWRQVCPGNWPLGWAGAARGEPGCGARVVSGSHSPSFLAAALWESGEALFHPPITG